VINERIDARKWMATGQGDVPRSLLKVFSKLRQAG
jgi:hypothetical protein